MSDKGLAEDRPLPDDWVKLSDVELLYLARAPVDSEGFGAALVDELICRPAVPGREYCLELGGAGYDSRV